MNNIKKVFVSCGEMSGDLHLSYIIEEIRKKDPNISFYGVVGDKSIAVGANKITHIKNNDIMGFVEALKKYKYFKQKALEYMEYIKNNNIDTVIFVDFGGFNLRFFKLLKKNIPSIKTIYYIPPKIWAWGKKRIETIKKFDDVIVIFPFEKEYFDKIEKKSGLNVKYFGNPLVDKYRFSQKLGKKIMLLPGSRKQEIGKFIPVIVDLIGNEKMKNEKFIMKFADKSHLEYAQNAVKNSNINLTEIKNLEISFDSIEALRDKCKYAVATSGTVTFELSLTGLPVITVYKTSAVNAFIARKIVKIKYITLTNLNADKEIFPELLQEDFNVEKLSEQCQIMEKQKEKIVEELKKEREKLGGNGVLGKISDYLLEKITDSDRK
ncbi:lipid-A-disaccharide synthase [Pseudoleptotrichia goodfellowii]|uniref:Lipid-A-disaccharide synthase n=2 Tax=Pseudoleptotrichia goodfellowii TaxID=157692 RepID=D0GKI5_9FUSO|nr:lipid-A-disaccharide synthase [Pseudoleptotrichia goodfellowii]EEY35399.1 lipid-A-disaccharide synthase [Pseudoleptotrichia goodfellowii F0264]BBM36238.1 lipid-A-disaccharide synthase [Pseudoleptotrichia goodfellowii]